MVLGFFDGSREIFALKNTCPFIVVVVSSPLQTRFICLRMSSGMGWPSAEPDTIVHSPCRAARSFLAASFSSARTGAKVRRVSPINRAFWSVFMFGFELRRGCNVRVIVPVPAANGNWLVRGGAIKTVGHSAWFERKRQRAAALQDASRRAETTENPTGLGVRLPS